MFKKDKTHVISLLVFYENRKTMIFKVLGSVIYCLMDNYICVDYLWLQQGLLYFPQKDLNPPHSIIFQVLELQNYQ